MFTLDSHHFNVSRRNVTTAAVTATRRKFEELKKKKIPEIKKKKTLVSAFTSMTSAVLHKSTSTTIVFIIMTTAEALQYMKKSTYSYSMVPDPFLRHRKFFSPTGLHGLTEKKTTKKN